MTLREEVGDGRVSVTTSEERIRGASVIVSLKRDEIM